mmetsp:Transcript_40805/g.123529  ORF Transcript_40805/g.123529 Transcript_40805/m.123529 type:complete len:518 (-) Transcript_40805:535-2088(-)
MGRVRLRGQHDWRARGGPVRLRQVHLQAAPRVLALLRHRHPRRYASAARQLGARAQPRADGPAPRFCWHAAARVRGGAAARTQALRFAGPAVACQARAAHRARARGRGGAADAGRLLRPPLRSRARALRQAHPHRQPAGGFGGGAPAGKRAGVLPLPPPHLPHRAVRLLPLARPLHRRQPLHRPLRRHRLLLLKQDGAARHPARPGRLGPRRRAPRCRRRPAARPPRRATRLEDPEAAVAARHRRRRGRRGGGRGRGGGGGGSERQGRVGVGQGAAEEGRQGRRQGRGGAGRGVVARARARRAGNGGRGVGLRQPGLVLAADRARRVRCVLVRAEGARVLRLFAPAGRGALAAANHVQSQDIQWAGGDGGRLPRGILVAARQDARGCARDGLVGLRLPDHRHRQSNLGRRREHVEPRAHRHPRPHPLRQRAEGALDRAPPRRLRARLGGRRRRRPCKVAALGPDRQFGLPRPLRQRPHLQQLRLLPRPLADTDDGEVAAVQARAQRAARRRRQLVVL